MEPDLKIIRYTSYAVVALMVVALVYGFAAGDFGAEGSDLLSMPWGRVTMIDLYSGAVLIGAWVVYRQGWEGSTIAWLALFVVLGHLGTATYVAVTAHRAGDDQQWFMMGRRARVEVNR